MNWRSIEQKNKVLEKEKLKKKKRRRRDQETRRLNLGTKTQQLDDT